MKHHLKSILILERVISTPWNSCSFAKIVDIAKWVLSTLTEILYGYHVESLSRQSGRAYSTPFHRAPTPFTHIRYREDASSPRSISKARLQFLAISTVNVLFQQRCQICHFWRTDSCDGIPTFACVIASYGYRISVVVVGHYCIVAGRNI